MNESRSDELLITGTLQLNTALTALQAMELGTAGRTFFEAIKEVRDAAAARDPQAEHDRVRISLKGGIGTIAIKADLIMSLELLGNNDQLPEEKLAALSLLELLTQ